MRVDTATSLHIAVDCPALVQDRTVIELLQSFARVRPLSAVVVHSNLGHNMREAKLDVRQ